MKIYLVQSLGREDPLGKGWQPAPVFLPGKSHGQRSLADYSPWGHKELDTTELQFTIQTYKPSFIKKIYLILDVELCSEPFSHFICDLLNIFSRLQLSVGFSFVWMPSYNVHLEIFCGLMFILNHMHLLAFHNTWT